MTISNSKPRAAIVLAALVIVLLPPPLIAGGASEPAAASSDVADRQQAGQSDQPVPEDAAMAVFAGGCFWCMEEAYEKVPGVYEAVSGYAGGDVSEPSYRQVTGGSTGHYEVVRVYYDEEALSYDDLLYIFWRNVDPIDSGGQFCDRGSSYLPAIFYRTETQEELATESRERLEESGRFSRPISVEILELDVIEGDGNDGFWVAEEYHQDYYLKNPVQYNFYKNGCGRVRRLEQLWGAEAGAPSFVQES